MKRIATTDNFRTDTRMRRSTGRPSNNKQPALLWWSVGCLTLKFALDAAMNKWGSYFPSWAIVILLVLPLIPFAIWAFLHERNVLSREWVFARFHAHPISISAIACIFLWIACNLTLRVVARLDSSPVSKSEKSLERKPLNAPAVPSSVSPSLASEPHTPSVTKPTTKSPKKLKPVATSQTP